MFCRNLTDNNFVPSVENTQTCLLTVIGVVVAVVAALLVFQSVPSPFSSFIAQNKLLLFYVPGGTGYLAIALFTLTLFCPEKPVSSFQEVSTEEEIVIFPADQPAISQAPAEEPLAPRPPKKWVAYVKAPPNIEVEKQKTLLRRQALQKIDAAKTTCSSVNWPQFAMMNNGSLVKFTSFDRGNQTQTVLNSYLDYLAILQSQGLFFSLEESALLITALIEILQDTKSILSAFPHASYSHLDNEECRKASIQIQEIINVIVKKKGFAYVLTGYCGSKKSAGHAMACKVKQPADLLTHILLYFLNLGEGANLHPKLNFTTTHATTSRCFYPSAIPVETWQNIGPAFIGHLLRFASDAVLDTEKKYTAKEIYKLQQTMGSLLPALMLHLANKMEGKLQDLGDCTDKVIRNIFLDFFSIEKDFSEEEISKSFLNLHLASLIAGYHDYQNNPHPYHQELLARGAEEFATVLLRSKTILDEGEYQLASEIIDVILEMSKEPLVIPHKPQALLVPPPTQFPLVPFPKKRDFAIQKRPINSVKLMIPPSFQPQNFHKDLSAAIQFLKNERNRDGLRIYLASLPIPQWDDPQDPWNEIPRSEIKATLQLLNGLLEDYVRNAFHYFYLSHHNPVELFTLYAIVDKLVRLDNPTTKLKNFASPFAVDRIERFYLFLSVDEERRYDQIKIYFFRNHQAAQGRIAFPIAIKLDFPKFVADKTKGIMSPGTNLLEFLEQFRSLGLLLNEADLWEILPEEIYILYLAAASADFWGNSCLSTGEELSPYITKIPRKSRKSGEQTVQFEVGLSHFHYSSLSDDFNILVKNCDKTSNEVICRPLQPLKEGKDFLSQETMDNLSLLMQHSSLKIGLAIPWMQSHLHNLHHPTVQAALEHCFFSPGVLKERIDAAPETINEIRNLITNACTEYRLQPENISAILFLIRLGITFECYLSNFQGKPLNETILLKYEKQLKELLSQLSLEKEDEEDTYLNTVCHFIYLQSLMPVSEERFIELYTYLFKYGITTLDNMCIYTSHSLHYQLLSLVQYKLINQLKTYLQLQGDEQQNCLNRICNSILNNLFLDQHAPLKSHWHWETLSTCFSEKYVLEFSNGSVLHRETGGKLTHTLASERREFRLTNMSLDPAALWIRHSLSVENDAHLTMYQSIDETFALFKPPGHQPAFMVSQDQQQLKEAVFSPLALQNLDFLSFFPLYHTYEENSSGQPYVVSYLQQTRLPFIRLNFTHQGVTTNRLDLEENPLPYHLVDLKKLDPKHPLFAHTLRFDLAQDILCFINEHTQEIEELYFKRLKLTFIRKPEGLQLKDTDFIFNPMPIRALGSLASQAIVLCHASGKLKIILSRPPQEKLRLGSDKKKGEHTEKSGLINYYIYELRKAQDAFPFDSLSANLFFIYFFKAHGEYETAYRELKKIRNVTIDDSTLHVLRQFLQLTDHSPFSLAFNLKLVLFVVDHFHLFPLNSKSQISEAHSLCEHAIYWYDSYLRATGSDHFNAIPCEWRLTEAEESRILTTFKREEIKDLPKILEVREELLNTTARSAKITFDPQKMPISSYEGVLHPSEFEDGYVTSFTEFPHSIGSGLKEEEWIENPIRITPSYLHFHFPKLYEMAKKANQNGTDPFDFILLALLKLEKKKHASILFYVRRFPSFFTDLNFPENQDKRESTIVFEGIILTIKALSSLEPFQRYWMATQERDSFDYRKTTTLSLPQKIVPTGPLPPVDPLEIDVQPFVDLFSTLFNPVPDTSLNALTLFDSSQLPPSDPLLKEIHKNYEDAYLALTQQSHVSYQLKRESLSKVTPRLKTLRDEYQSQVEASEKRIHEYVNDPFHIFHEDFTLAEVLDFRLKMNAHQTYHITPEMIMRKAILENSTLLFDEHRPMLKPEHLKIIIEEVHHYYHVKVLATLCNDALGHIETLTAHPEKPQPIVEKELLLILHYSFTYAPEKYPEIGYMKLKTGKMPRPEQMGVYLWICEGLERNENRLFQLPSGGGKTSYLIPLFILRSKRHKLFPCVLTTQAMYPTEKENLGHTLSLLEEELNTLEVGMHTQFTLKTLQTIFQNLKKNALSGNSLILTPPTFYALRLAYFIAAVEDEEGERTILLGNILSVFKLRALLLGDESHRNLDPMTQAVFGIGNFIHLSNGEVKRLFELMKPLLGILPPGKDDPKDKEKLAEIQRLLQGKLEQEDMQRIKWLLASYYTDDPAMIAFLINKKAQEPSALAAMGEEKRYYTLMTRFFLNTLLPKMLKMKIDFDHVYSRAQGEIDTPSYHKTPSHAQFRDPYLTCVLSIKGTWHRGLTNDQLIKLIDRLKKENQDEQPLSSNKKLTPAQRKFQGWIQPEFATLTLQDVHTGKSHDNRALFEHLRKHPLVLEYYLTHLVISRMGYASDQFTSTPAHLMDMSKCSVIFSATPLIRMAYPQALQDTKYDPLFETRVIAEASKKKNQNFIFPKDVASFFAQLKQQDATTSRNGRYLIDADGFLCHEPNHEVAQKWLEASHMDGVIYFKEDEQKEGIVNENICLRLRDQRIIEFKGTDHLKEKLALHDIDFDSLAIGFYYDAERVESANFPAIPHTNFYVLGGSSLNIPHAIQAIMRARGFLDSAIDQRLIWVIPQSLMSKKKAKSETFSSSILFSWFLQNGVSTFRKVILMAAYQEIAFKIENLGLKDAPNRFKAIKKYEKGFRDTLKPNQHWDSQEQLEDTDKILWSFAKEIYSRFEYPEPFENAAIREQLATIVTGAKNKVAQMMIDFRARATTELHQKCIVQEEVHKIHYANDRPPLRPVPLKPYQKIDAPDYLNHLNSQYTAREIFKTPELTKGLFLEPNQIHTAHSVGIELKEKFLKPINFLMIVIKGDTVIAEAISHDTLILQIESLKNPSKATDIQHQAFIIRADGVLYLKGSDALTPSNEKIRKILKSKWLQDVLIDIALLKGHILNTERFSERLQQWPNFFEFWERILKALPYEREYAAPVLDAYVKTALPKEKGCAAPVLDVDIKQD